MASKNETLRLLVIGSSSLDRETLSASLSQQLSESELRPTDELNEATAWSVSGDWSPDLVILSMGYSYAWPEEDLAELWNAIPLARWIVVLDGWTRSSLRHKTQFPPGVCIPKERLAIRLEQELRVLRGESEPVPLTASFDETFVRDAELADVSLSGLKVAIFSSDKDLKGWLRELMKESGAELVSLEQNPDAVLWDLDPARSDRLHQIETYRRRDPGCLILGLRNTVHELGIQEATRAGVDILIPKQLGGHAILGSLTNLDISVT